MASSDDYANAVLLREVSRGGSVWLGFLDAVPPDDLSSFSLIADIPPVELPLDGASTWTVALRAAHPTDPIAIDTSGVTADVVVVSFCLFEDEACTDPSLSGRIADIKVTPGSVVNVPPTTVNIPYPATLAATL